MRIAIIGGSGKMGKWFAALFVKDNHQVIINARNERNLRETGRLLNIPVTTSMAEAVEGADIVLLSVPIDSFEGVVEQLKPCLSPEQTVIDITSVKVMPLEAMHRHLPGQPVLGTHPVFGPGAQSARNQNFVLTPTDDAETVLAGKVSRYLEERGGQVTTMTPHEHDEMMAVILGLSHFIAIASADVLLGFERLEQMKAIGGPTYKVLVTLAESVITEDPDLYASIQMNLPRMTEMEELFLRSSTAWTEIVRKKDRREFTRRMNFLKKRVEKSAPDFGQSYRDMYRMLDEK
jgi:prephenate dehydrogenase